MLSAIFCVFARQSVRLSAVAHRNFHVVVKLPADGFTLAMSPHRRTCGDEIGTQCERVDVASGC